MASPTFETKPPLPHCKMRSAAWKRTTSMTNNSFRFKDMTGTEGEAALTDHWVNICARILKQNKEKVADMEKNMRL